MADLFFDTFDGDDANTAKFMKVTSTQRSPSDLQNFYENFDPESNEDCLFGYSCTPDDMSKCNNRIIANNENAHPIRFNQIASQCKSSFEYSCSNQNSHINRVASSELSSKGCIHGKQIKKTITKKKRKRTTFTTEQIIAMEQIFKTRPYICREERLMLTQKLQVNEKSIKVWFQNRRRISEKRENEYVADSPSSVDTCDSNSDRLAYIESQINERVDQYGNVVLDEGVMTELVNIIDECLPKETEALINPMHIGEPHKNYLPMPTDDKETLVPDGYCSSYTMYEPISPASVLDEFFS